MEEKVIADEKTMRRTLARLAHEIIEKDPDQPVLYLVGIRRRGVPMAQILKEDIEKFSDIRVEVGELDISLYRDDLEERYPMPLVSASDLPFDVNKQTVILVDDVIYTGRTARAAMDAVISRGRPAKILLAVMVDRGHRELPICANFVGKNIPTSLSEIVSVRLDEVDGETNVSILERKP